MNSTPNPYPSYHGLEWMTHDGAYQRTAVTGPVASSQIEPDQVWVLQQLEDLMAVTAQMDAKLRELQDLNQKKQDILAWMSAVTRTTTPAWNIPLQPTTFSSSSTAPYTQTITHQPPLYTAHNCAGEKVFEYETPRNGEKPWYCETLRHAKKRYTCHCGKGYTRKDSLLRHAAIHASENSYI